MPRRAGWTLCLSVIVFATALRAQGQFSIRAASAEAIEGWQRMQVEHSNRVVWIAPTAAVVASDERSRSAMFHVPSRFVNDFSGSQNAGRPRTPVRVSIWTCLTGTSASIQWPDRRA